MEIQQFEQLESKIISLVDTAKRQKEENNSLSLKNKELDSKVSMLTKKSVDFESLNDENIRLLDENKKLKSDMELVGGKIKSLMSRIDGLVSELK